MVQAALQSRESCLSVVIASLAVLLFAYGIASIELLRFGFVILLLSASIAIALRMKVDKDKI